MNDDWNVYGERVSDLCSDSGHEAAIAQARAEERTQCAAELRAWEAEYRQLAEDAQKRTATCDEIIDMPTVHRIAAAIGDAASRLERNGGAL